jgi:DNA-binding HxlR family transcriptional regulator
MSQVDGSLRVFDSGILHEHGLVEVEQTLQNLTNRWLIDVLHELEDDLLVDEDVLKDFPGVASNKYLEQIAPVG